MGIWVPWLGDAARLTGYPVVEVAGWRTRGHGPMRTVEGVVAHHTAGRATGDFPSLATVRDGRPNLVGPLSNLGLGRTGTIFVVAAGCCWHAGASAWAGFQDLNDEFLGIEAESVGTRDDWTPQQRECYPRLVAALLYYMRRDAGRFAGHLEAALPKGRKVDPAYWDLPGLRSRVAWLLGDPAGRIPLNSPPEEDIMASLDDLRRVLREEVMDETIPKQGSNQAGKLTGNTSVRLNHAWTPAAWAKQEDAVRALEGQVKALTAQVVAQDTKLDAILAAVTGPKA